MYNDGGGEGNVFMLLMDGEQQGKTFLGSPQLLNKPNIM
jgi:hypothetical protein